MANPSNRRHSRPAEAELIHDPHKRDEVESLNALRQFDQGVEIVRSFIERERPFKLRVSMLLGLHRTALDGLSSYAGNFRPGHVAIEQSKHEPPPAHLVPELVEEFCDYVNENWDTASPLHLAAYAMWRINWIHPFADGNGRTSRIVSYILLCTKLGYLVPGTNSIPDQITANRDPYFDALDAADEAWRSDTLDVTKMEKLLSGLLAAQLLSVVEDAGHTAPEVQYES